MLVSELASLIDGKIDGKVEETIDKVSTIDDAGENDLVFCLEEKYFKNVGTTKAKAVVVPKSFKEKTSKIIIKVANPRLAMAKVLEKFSRKELIEKGIHKKAVVGKGVNIGEDVSIGPYSVISDGVSIGDNAKIFPHVFIGKNSEIGNDSIIYSNVSVYHDVRIGNRVIIHSGAVVGADGFGFVPAGEKYEKIPQIGGVEIEDDVEIGACTTIDRGTIGNTIIKCGSKIDNLVMIAHNCELGENCALAAQTGLSGSTILEGHVSMGGQAGTKGHLTIGKNSTVMARAGVTKDIEPGKIVSGFPAQDHDKEMKMQASLRRLDELIKKVNRMEKELK